MNKIFCVSCGFKIFYEVNAPKFCSNCGQSANANIAPKKITPTIRRQAVASFSDDDDEYVEDSSFDIESIDLNRLKRDISVETYANKVTFKDIIASATNTPEDSYQRPASNLPDGEELLQLSQRECGSSRMTEINE
jgi:hypothetical protein